ncbi:MAG: hypothetical protein P8H99_04150 [Luminiphilus sp.]|nr:hypothetical protein [Luminiphilus sp.]
MSQDPVDDVLILNTSDDFDGHTAATTNFNVDIEYSLESLSPSHGGMALSR